MVSFQYVLKYGAIDGSRKIPLIHAEFKSSTHLVFGIRMLVPLLHSATLAAFYSSSQSGMKFVYKSVSNGFDRCAVHER